MNESHANQARVLLDQLHESKRAPNELLQSWHETNQAEEDSTPRIFLNEGSFSAWVAYVLTRNAAKNQNHFPGKAACSRLIADLETATIGCRKLLAAEVARGVTPEAEERMLRLYDKTKRQSQIDDGSQQSSKRRRKFSIQAPLSFLMRFRHYRQQ